MWRDFCLAWRREAEPMKTSGWHQEEERMNGQERQKRGAESRCVNCGPVANVATVNVPGFIGVVDTQSTPVQNYLHQILDLEHGADRGKSTWKGLRV